MVPDEVLVVLGPHLSLSTRTGRCKLSLAEWRVLFLVVTARGLSSSQIADRLGLADDDGGLTEPVFTRVMCNA